MKKGIIGAIVAAAIAVPAIVVPLTTNSTPKSSTPFAATPGVPTPGAFVTLPNTGGNLNCGANESGKISSFLNNLPANSTVDFPASGSGPGGHACYTISGSIKITHANNLTINGNGAVFNQWPPYTSPPDTLAPILFVLLSSGVTVNDVVLAGAWDGHNGMGGPCACGHGENYEGEVGAQLQAVNGFTMRNSAIVGTQGDCFSAQLPTTPPAAGTNRLNTNVIFTNNQENLCGYTSASIESVNGLTFNNNTITNGSARDFSFEVDGASTFYACQSCAPGFAGVLNATFNHNTITDVDSVTTGQQLIDDENGAISCTTAPCHPACPANGSAFQTQTKGVCTYYYIAQKAIAFTNNTIICNTGATPNACPVANIIGTNPNLPPPAGQTRGLVNGFTFSGNVMTKGKGGAVAGGNVCGTDTGSIFYISNAIGFQMNGNTIPVQTAPTGSGCTGNSYLSGVQVAQSQGAAKVSNNTFNGASSTLNSNSSHLRGLVTSGNTPPP